MSASTTTPTTAGAPTTGARAMRELRATRQRHRLGEIEWFDAAYKVYVFGLFGGLTLLWLSDLVGDAAVTDAQAASVAHHGPAVLGMVAVLAFCVGLRSGAQGGPLALEAGDVVHVMLSPVPRRAALLRPTAQRLRSAIFAAAGLAAVLSQLAGRRLPGTPVAWFGAGLLFGANVGALWVGAALVAHTLRLPLWLTSLIGAIAIGWQGAAIADRVPGPADLDGSLGLWGWRQHPADVIALVLTAALVVIGVSLVARTSLEALARRASLVAQLRFAVTMQDMRTVILLRRQLSHEHTRSRPWLRLPRVGRAHPVWRRGWHSLLRLPLGRLVRMAVVAAAAGACQVAVLHGTTPALLGTTMLTFLLGLDILEPLSQEVDQPDRTDSFPIDRGELLMRHLAAPGVALLPFAALAAASAALVDRLASPTWTVRSTIVVAAILAVPTVLGGAAGAAVSVVRDAPDPMSDTTQAAFMPPEMAGFGTVLRTVIPLVISAVGALPIIFVRVALDDGTATGPASAVRGGVLTLLVVSAVVAWVRFRDRAMKAIRGFMAEGRTQTAQQRSTR